MSKFSLLAPVAPLRRFVGLALLVVFASVASPSSAFGTNYSVPMCFEYQVDFEDADVSGVGDFWTTNSDKIARGIRVKITDNTTGVDVFYGYTSATTGCTTQVLSNLTSYRVRLYSEATVSNNNLVVVRVGQYNDTRYYYDADDAFTPTSSAGQQFVFGDPNSGDNDNLPNIMAAAGFAVHNRYGGLTGQTWKLYNEPCPTSTGSCVGWTPETGDAVFLSVTGKSRKFIIAHEVGHLLARKRDEGAPVLNFTAAGDTCELFPGNDAHDYASKEFQTAAAVEGFAHFYAAAVWNDSAQYDCDFYYYKEVDFLAPWDGSADPTQAYDCESGEDFLESRPCGGTVDDRSVEVDWLRFWWDIHTNGGESFGTIADIFDGANPWSWTAANVYTRMRSSASYEGVDMSTWDDYADDGTHNVNN